MNTTKLIINRGLLFLVLISFISCNENKALLEKFAEIKQQIDDSDHENLIANFDKRSREYIQLMVDTSNFEYEIMKAKTEPYNLHHFSVNYLFEFSGFNEDTDNKYGPLFLYYAITGIPLFDVLRAYELREKQTKTGKENHVTIARKIQDNTYLTKKIKFVKEGDEFKLNFLDLFSRHEKDLAVSVKRYKKKFIGKLPEEIIQNPIIDSTLLKDYLYTYMHYSHRDDYNPTVYSYRKSAEKRRRKTE